MDEMLGGLLICWYFSVWIEGSKGSYWVGGVSYVVSVGFLGSGGGLEGEFVG